ncbi:KEOPS complex subunit Pcc1 [Caldiplasma sukawensis]
MQKEGNEKIINSILPNLDEKIGRAKISWMYQGDFFQVYIEGSDTNSIRAALGSISKWLIVAEKIIKEV